MLLVPHLGDAAPPRVTAPPPSQLVTIGPSVQLVDAICTHACPPIRPLSARSMTVPMMCVSIAACICIACDVRGALQKTRRRTLRRSNNKYHSRVLRGRRDSCRLLPRTPQPATSGSLQAAAVRVCQPSRSLPLSYARARSLCMMTISWGSRPDARCEISMTSDRVSVCMVT
jgi:hypothetical protein